MNKNINKFIEECNSLAMDWVNKGIFKNQEEIELAKNLKMVIEKWEKRKSVKSFKRNVE